MAVVEIRSNKSATKTALNTANAQHAELATMYCKPSAIYKHVVFVNFACVNFAVKAKELGTG